MISLVGRASSLKSKQDELFRRVAHVWFALRPRTIAQTHRRVDDLHIKLGNLQEQLRDVTLSLKELKSSIARLEVKESQLRAISRRDIELEGEEESLASVMCDRDIQAHVTRQIAAAPISDYPFPHAVVDRLFPDSLYDALIRGLPPVELFGDRAPNKRQLAVPLTLAPAYTRRIWAYMAKTVVERILAPAIVAKFKPALSEWISMSFPALGENPLDRVRTHASDGRILLRTRGYVIPPHRDPKWGFLTCLLYLARPGDSESWGTQLYSVEGDEEARGTAPNWIDSRKCQQVSEVTFLPNRAFVFLNSTGAHGARIPDDAPAQVERYAYQFRIGPRSDAIDRLIQTLPPERRPFWGEDRTEY